MHPVSPIFTVTFNYTLTFVYCEVGRQTRDALYVTIQQYLTSLHNGKQYLDFCMNNLVNKTPKKYTLVTINYSFNYYGSQLLR